GWRRGPQPAQVLPRLVRQIGRDGMQEGRDSVRFGQGQDLRPTLLQAGQERNAPKQTEQYRLGRLRPPFRQFEREPHPPTLRDPPPADPLRDQGPKAFHASSPYSTVTDSARLRG